MELFSNSLTHAMHLVAATRATLLIVGKVIFDALTRQVFRQGLAAALLALRLLGWRKASVRQVDEIAVVVASVLFIGNPLGFIEEAIHVLFAFRRKTMQPCEHQLFLELDHAFRELTVFRLQRCNTRHQLLNSGFAGLDHPILESEPFRPVNRRRRELSAGDLVLSNRMADHRVDINAIENPVELLGRKRYHRRLSVWPSEPVLGQSLQDHYKTGPIEEQELHPVTAAIAEREDRRRKRVEFHRLLDQDRKAVDAGAKVDRFAVQIDLEISA